MALLRENTKNRSELIEVPNENITDILFRRFNNDESMRYDDILIDKHKSSNTRFVTVKKKKKLDNRMKICDILKNVFESLVREQKLIMKLRLYF